MNTLKTFRRLIVLLAVIMGLAVFMLPRLRPIIDELQKRTAEAIDEGRQAARQRELELEQKLEE